MSGLFDEVLNQLREREVYVIRQRFGLGCDRRTLAGVASGMRTVRGDRYISKHRVRQIESTALRKLRSPKLARQLFAVMEATQSWRDGGDGLFIDAVFSFFR